MRGIARSALLLALAGAAGLACQDIIAVRGACPEFCPEGEIRVRDTLIADVEPVGSFSGYLLPHEAREVQVVGPGGPAEARGLLVFVPFSARYAGGDTTVRDTIRQTDSLQVRLNIVRRNTNVSGLTIALHEIPITVDSSTTFAAIEPYFQDSTLLSALQVPDSTVKDTVTVTFPASALRHFGPDSLQIAIGVRITSLDPAFVSLGATADTATTTPIVLMRRFVQVDSTAGNTRVTRTDVVGLRFKTFVADPAGLPQPAGLLVGGAAGARAFVKLHLPASIVDSTLVVRATLQWVPPQPIFGAPGDTLVLRVAALGSDFGSKSPVADTSLYGGTVRVAVGGSDTVAIDVTSILRLWRDNAAVPRTVRLQLDPEASSINALELPTQGAGAQPAIRVTYALPFRLPGS